MSHSRQQMCTSGRETFADVQGTTHRDDMPTNQAGLREAVHAAPYARHTCISHLDVWPI